MRIAALATMVALVGCAQERQPQTWRVRSEPDVSGETLSVTNLANGLFALSITCFADETDMYVLVFPPGVGAGDADQDLSANLNLAIGDALVFDEFAQHVQGGELRIPVDPFMRTLVEERDLSLDAGFGVQHWPVATRDDLSAVEEFGSACRARGT